MSVLWPHSGMVCRDNNDFRCVGAKAFFYNASTTSPRTVYRDAELSSPHTHPVLSDGAGRWPAIYLPFGNHAERITTAADKQLWFYTEVRNTEPTNPSQSVDTLQLLTTGMTIWVPVGTTFPGFIRMNGRSLGSAASGATERANSDVEDLFIYVWNNIANTQAPVSAGRGATAAADWSANKTITPPNMQLRLPAGLADMGNTSRALDSAVPFVNGDKDTGGSVLGSHVVTQTTTQLPPHTHPAGTLALSTDGVHSHGGATGADTENHTHEYAHFNPPDFTQVAAGLGASVVANVFGLTNTTAPQAQNHTHPINPDGDHTHTVSGSTANVGSGAAMNNMAESVLGTWLMKL